MKKLFSLFAVIALIAITTQSTFSQSSANYTFSTATNGSLVLDANGNAIDMSTGTTLLSGSSTDQGLSPIISIGFDFWLMGVRYNQFAVTTNGLLSLSNSATATTGSTYVISGGSVTTPVISAFAADLGTGNIGKTHYKIVGTAPNRCLVVEYKNMTLLWTSSYTNDGTYQVRLYENSGKVEFVYGTMSITSTASASDATVGIGFATNTTANNLSWVTSSTNTAATTAPFTDNATYSTGPITNLNSGSDGSRRIYLWTPAIPTAPSALNFTAVTASGMTLNWTDNSSNEIGFAIYRSDDGGTTYNYVSQVGAGVTSSVQAGLGSNTTYFWKVYAVTEGGQSSALSGSQATLTGTKCGTYTVGPTGTYTSITAAVADITTNGLCGSVILELQTTYVSTVETYPLAITSTLPTSATNTLTIRPITGATGLSINSANTTATVNLNGARYVTFDGRPGGSGTSQLTISNTALTGPAVQYINDARFNTIQYCTIAGVNTTAGTSGVVLFSTTTGLLGNSNNTITYCDLRDGATTPANLICSNGTNGVPNKYISVTNCNLYNWFLAATTVQTGAINLVAGCSDWTITGNSFYQTASRTFTSSGIVSAISVNNTVNSTNYTISNNYIGGSSANCGGAALTWTATTGTPVYRVLYFAASNAGTSTISGNTIANISMTSATTSTAVSILSHLNGSVNITNNTIGSQSATGNISYVNSGTSTATIMYGYLTGNGANPADITMTGNTIGGINVSTSSTGSVAFRILYTQAVVGSNITISNNTVGGTVANSLNQATNNTIFGILDLSASLNQTISGNTVQNLTINNTGATGAVHGINCQGLGKFTVSGNIVRNLTTNGTNIAFGNGASIVGMNLTQTGTLASGNIITGNQVYNLVNTNNTVAGVVVGIVFVPTTVTSTIYGTISKNFVHSFSAASTTASQVGIWTFNSAGTAPCMISNNMVRLGIDASGNSNTVSNAIYGIYKSSTANLGMYFNSVYIGGSSVVSGAVNTYAFRRTTSGTADTVLNNIFFNARSNASGTGKHYAEYLNATTVITSNYNAGYVNGTGGVYGFNGTTDYADLNAWKSGSGLDANSTSGNPQYINPTGTSSSVDLHISTSLATVIESTGLALSQVSDDYDSQTRSGLTPTDIGADAGNFIPNDLTPPSITYTVLSNTTSTANRSFTNVTITDASGVNGSSPRNPKCYYKRSTDGNVWNDNTSGTDGWKYAESNGGSSPFDFTIDYSLLNGGAGVASGDVIQYFVVAEDNAGTPNVGINSGSFAAAQSTCLLDVSAFPIGGTINSYIIVGAPLSGTYTVGLSMMKPLTGRNIEVVNKTRKVKVMVPEESDNTAVKETKKGEEQLKLDETINCSVDNTGRNMKEIEVEESYSELYENGSKYNGPMFAEYPVNKISTKGNNSLNNNINNDNTSVNGGDMMGNYATITAALTDLNNRGVSGAVTFLLIDANYAGETYPLQINNNVSGVSVLNPVTIKPQTGVTATIPGTVATNAVFRILSNYVTIDGSNAGSTDRSLTIQNNNVTSPNVILIGSTGTTPITNVTVKNCIITDGANTSTAVVISDASTIGNPGYFNTITIQNNLIEKAYIGVYATGGTSAANGFNLIASDNTLTSSGASSIRLVGLYAQYVNGATFSNNNISNIANTTDAANMAGIWCATGTSNVTVSGNTIGTFSNTASSSTYTQAGILMTSAVTGSNNNITTNTISNITSSTSATTSGITLSGATDGVTIQRNTISNIKNTNTVGWGCNGIYLNSSSTTGTITVQNNMIFDIAAYGYISNSTVTDNGYGIIASSGAGYKIYNNSILLNTNQTVSGLQACINFTTGVTTANALDIRNNIFANTQTVGTNRYSIYSGAASSVYSNINYNCYYTTGPNIGIIGAIDRAAMSNWRTGTGKDGLSFNNLPAFLSSTNLRITPSDLSVSGRGNFISTVNNDIDNDSRATSQSTSLRPVDVGCDQYTPASYTGTVMVLSGSTYFDGNLRGIDITGGTFTASQVRQFTGVRTPNNAMLKNSNNPVKQNDNKNGNKDQEKKNIRKNGTSGGQKDVSAVNVPWIYWEIADLVPATEPITLRFYYNDDQLATITESALKLSYWNGSAWDNNFVQSLDAVNNYIQVTLPTGVTWGSNALFSMEDGGAPLPVVLSSFDAAVNKRDISLTWATESELNNKGFGIERRLKTPEGSYSNWKEISFIEGKGNSNSHSVYSFTDKKLNTGSYQYRLKQVDFNGNYEYHSPVNNSDMVIGKPGSFDVSQNYPNPSNPKSKIDFQMPFDGKVSIKVYDILGQQVASLIDEFKQADFYTVEFDGSNISSGTYFYRIIAEGDNQKFTKTMKMILVK